MRSFFARFSITLVVTIFLIKHEPLVVQSSILPEKFFDLDIITQILQGKNVWSLFSSLFEKYFLPDNLEENSCYMDLKNVAVGIFKLENWALSMIDAFGKPGANVIGGNLGWAGSFKECLNVKNGSISGKYCWIKVFSPENKTIKTREKKWSLSAICVPNSCNHNDLKPFSDALNEITKKMSVSIMTSIDCVANPIENLNRDVVAITAIGFCCVLIAFAVVGTGLDLLKKTSKNKTKHYEENLPINHKENHEDPKYYNKKFCQWHQFFLHFSLYSNSKELFLLEQKQATFPELNGLKVISMWRVIFCHSYHMIIRLSENNLDAVKESANVYLQIPFHTIVINIFFLATSFLTSLGILIKLKANNTNNCQFIMSYIFQRYLRLLVFPGIIMFVLRIGLQPYLSSGPFWEPEEPTCRSNWWQNMLFISNWWSQADQCFLAWWFLSVSMQLHVIALLVIIPLINKSYRLSIFNGCALLIFAWCWTGWKSYQLDIPAHYPQGNIKDFLEYYDKRNQFYDTIYTNPLNYFGAYFIGMALSWIIIKHKNTIALTKKQVYLGWILWGASLWAVNYCIYFEPSILLKSLHTAFVGTIHSMSIAWLIVICNTKEGGIVSSVLRWKYWLPLSKLTLTVFLIQIPVIECIYFSELTKFHYSFRLLFTFFVRNLVITYAIAILVTLAIEMPTNTFVNLIIKRWFEPKGSTIKK